MKQVFCRIHHCLACRACELACAAAHSRSGSFEQSVRESEKVTPRIRVERIGETDAPCRTRTLALQCRHCEDPVCVQACISGGLQRDAESGRVQIDPERCVGCWSCIMVCPFGALARDEHGNRAVKCDLCRDRGTPACVGACPTRALVFCERDDIILKAVKE
jgi:anaerobic carbon-monoxide dehydrogenase iron sulfur subunit